MIKSREFEKFWNRVSSIYLIKIILLSWWEINYKVNDIGVFNG